MPSQPAEADASRWIRLEVLSAASEEQTKGAFAQLVIATASLAVLALFFTWWLRDWPLLVGALCIFLGGVWGGVLCSWLGRWRHGRKVRGVFGPCAVWMRRRTSTDQAFAFRAQQVFKKPVHVDRLTVSLAYVERILRFTMVDHAPMYSLRDQQLWSAAKTTAFEGRFFPADGMIEVRTEFDIPDEAGLRPEHQEAHETETERTLHWQVRIETFLTDGLAVNALFAVPSQL